MIGRTLAHYKILEKIGSGGMGDVYLAEDNKLDRKVALKVLPPDLAENEERRARFQREAKAIAALDHTNIVQVFSVEEAEGTHFITMQLVQGKTLTELLPKHGFPLNKFFDIAIPLADAVAAAHEQGIVHRDLKSGNVMVTDDDRTKVLDFGLARRDAPVRVEGDSESPTAVKTQEGVLAGTLHYMSPEQAEGKIVDARSDIFSLGIVFYEMLTGERPFHGDTPASTLSAVIKDEPRSITGLVPSLPRDMARIVKRCLAKDPTRRYQTAIDVRNELEELARALDSGEIAEADVTTPARARGNWLPWVAMGVFGVMIALWMAGVFGTTVEAPLAAIPTFTNARQINPAIGIEDNPTWSPDGLTLAYGSSLASAKGEGPTGDVWVQRIDGGPPVNRTPEDDGGAGLPSWSPDGSRIAFLSERDGSLAYFVMSALGGEARKVMDTTSNTLLYTPPQWLGGGTELAGISDDGETLEIVELATRRSRTLELPVAARGTADWRWSPDERLIAYVVAVSRPAQISRIWILRVEDGVSFPITGDGNNWNPMWSQDGGSLFYISNRGGAMDLWVQRIDFDEGPVGAAVPVTVGVGMRSASFSRDLTKLAYSKGRPVGNVWRVPILTDRMATWADAESISSEEAYIEELDLSPDGTELVLNSDRAGNLDLWVVPLDGGEWRALTTNLMPDWAPRYSADGRRVVFHSHNDGSRDLFIVPSDGGVIQSLIESPEFELQATLSPDGRRVAYYHRTSGNIWVASTEDGSAGPLIEAPGNLLMPEWSPDGSQILYTELTGSGVNVLWKASGSGENPDPVVEANGWAARWSPDGRSIYFMRDENIWVVSADGTDERRLTDLSGKRGLLGRLGLATDGRYLYFTWTLDMGDIWVMDVVTDQD